MDANASGRDRRAAPGRRAVLISPDPASNAGGVERFCHLLATRLVRAGFSTSTVGPELSVPIALARIGLGPPLQALSATRRARREPADLVISNGFLGGPAGARRIHVFHGTMVEHVRKGVTGTRRYRVREAVGGGLAEALCGRGATTVAVSGSTAREVERLYRQRVDRVIPNAVDTELFSPGDRAAARARLRLEAEGDRRLALFVGRFEHRKGADLVSEACRRAGFRLLVAGAGPPESAVALGTLTPGELVHAYRAADCVLFPTRYEGFGYVTVEALACGVPVITTPVGWMRDFLAQCEDYSALIVRPEVDSVAEALARLADVDAAPLLARARAFIERENSLEVFGERWLELIAEVTGR
jgi:glycosyltransferase involved in cell wall biosynthesis